MNKKETKKIYHPKISCQKIKIVGWPRCYRRRALVKQNLWQTIRAMLF
ncbi:hypothetical protein KJ840_04425 [Patescibacteria group bacterium]|nr:hypothetical protein [Patescibacteria group bacterium]